jgi:hypothetical protein
MEYQKEFTDPGISERMHRPWNIRKNSQTLEYQKECTDPGISERMHRPWNIRKNSQTLEYQKECTACAFFLIFHGL